MIDIIRVKLEKGIQRFPLLTVRDHLSLLMTSADMEGKTPTEQMTILDEVLDTLYPGYSKTEQEYIFTKVYCASFGKNAIKIGIRTSTGVIETFMVIQDYELQNEYTLDDNLVLGFTYPRDREISEKMFLDCIRYIIHDGKRYDWDLLEESTKDDILNVVSMEDMENIITMLRKSCNAVAKENTIDTLLPLFKILFTKAELNEFFKTNYLLNRNNLHVDTMMSISPMERSIYVALLGDDLKQRNEK